MVIDHDKPYVVLNIKGMVFYKKNQKPKEQGLSFKPHKQARTNSKPHGNKQGIQRYC